MLEIDRAQTVSMAKDRDFGGRLDVADEFVRTTRNDKVNVLVQIQELRNHIASCDELDGGVWDRRGLKRRRYNFGDGDERLGRFFST
jgi:hypothetical protein